MLAMVMSPVGVPAAAKPLLPSLRLPSAVLVPGSSQLNLPVSVRVGTLRDGKAVLQAPLDWRCRCGLAFALCHRCS
jgi:hypothetical protein